MHSEIVEKHPGGSLAVYVLWLPMIASDDEAAARGISAMYGDPRVLQFYDPDRLAGIALSREVRPEDFKDLLASMPPDHPLRQRMAEWFASPPEARPVWDAVYLFPPGARWARTPPRPAFWTKQMGFFGDQPGDAPSGLFLRQDSTGPPAESDWFVELRAAMKLRAAALPAPLRPPD